MAKRVSLLICAALVISLSACGGRTPRPVAVSQSYDVDMNCTQIANEIEGNNKKITQLSVEREKLTGRNVAVATAGVLLMGVGALFLIDDGEAQETEIASYSARNRHLADLGAEKGCSEEANGVAPTVTSAETNSTVSTEPNSPSAQATTETAALDHDAAYEEWWSENKKGFRGAFARQLVNARIHGYSGDWRVDSISSVRYLGWTTEGYRVAVSYVMYGDNWSMHIESHDDTFIFTIEEGVLTSIKLDAAS